MYVVIQLHNFANEVDIVATYGPFAARNFADLFAEDMGPRNPGMTFDVHLMLRPHEHDLSQ